MTEYYVQVSADDTMPGRVSLETALQALGYLKPIFVEPSTQVKLVDLQARCDIYKADLADLQARYDSCKADLADVETDRNRWRKEANDAIDERIKTQQKNEQLAGVIRQLTKRKSRLSM